MKVLYLMASTGTWGGLEKHVFEMANAVSQQFSVIVVAHREYRSRVSDSVEFIPYDWSDSRNNPLAWRRLRIILNNARADIIHAHADKAAKMLSRSGWPKKSAVVGTVHNLKSSYSVFKKFAARIAVSQIVANDMRQQDVTVIYNGIQAATLDPVALAKIHKWKQDKPNPLFLAVGRLVTAKGFDLLLEAWPDNAAVSLVILGDGEQKPALEAIIQKRHLTHVYLLGASTQVAEWMASSDLLIISSRNEGGPYVLPEALLAKLAVVSTPVGMVPDFLPDSCWLPESSTAELTVKLKHIISHLADYKKACEPAMLLAEQKLTTEAMINSTITVYQRLLDRNVSIN